MKNVSTKSCDQYSFSVCGGVDGFNTICGTSLPDTLDPSIIKYILKSDNYHHHLPMDMSKYLVDLLSNSDHVSTVINGTRKVIYTELPTLLSGTILDYEEVRNSVPKLIRDLRTVYEFNSTEGIAMQFLTMAKDKLIQLHEVLDSCDVNTCNIVNMSGIFNRIVDIQPYMSNRVPIFEIVSKLSGLKTELLVDVIYELDETLLFMNTVINDDSFMSVITELANIITDVHRNMFCTKGRYLTSSSYDSDFTFLLHHHSFMTAVTHMLDTYDNNSFGDKTRVLIQIFIDNSCSVELKRYTQKVLYEDKNITHG